MSPHFWSSPGDPGASDVEDVVLLEAGPRPDEDGTFTVPCRLTVKHTPLADEFEMYNVSDDQMERHNLYGNATYAEQQRTLAALLEQQCSQKRLQPSSGTVPGQPSCGP
jgi:choline-sulfatase